jgi:hypothetical protein
VRTAASPAGASEDVVLTPREILVSMGALVAAAVLGFGFLWRGGMTPYSRHSDFLFEHVGTKQILFDSVRGGGGLPLWRSDKLSGYEALTNPVSQFTYPLDVLFLLEPPLAAAGPTYWLHFLAAGVVYWLAAAALGLGFWPRLLVGVGGMFGFKLILAAYAGWLPNIPGIVFFPALIAAVFHLERRPRLGAALGLALAGALCLHCGVLQLPYYAALFCAVCVAVFALSRVRSGRRREAAALCGWASLSAALALALSAYLILPLAAEAPLVSRSRSTYEFFLSGHALRWPQLKTFVAPEALGTPLDDSYPGIELWEDEGYFGLILLVLAVVGAVCGRRRPATPLLAGGFVGAVALTMDTPVLRALFEHLPGFDLFRVPSRFLFLASFFGVVLAGVGLEEILARARPRSRRATAALAGALVLLVAAEGAFYARRYLAMRASSEAVPRTDYEGFFAADKDVFRVAVVGRATINYGWAALKGLQLITGNDSFNYQAYHEFFETMQWGKVRSPRAGAWYDLINVSRERAGFLLPVRGDMLDALNVKYVAALGPMRLKDGRWRLVARFRDQPLFLLYQGMRRVDLWVYRNDAFFPRAFWAGEAVPAPPDDAGVFDAVRRADLRRTALVSVRGEPLPDGRGRPGDAVRVARSSPGRLSVDARASEARYLVVGEIWHPGWRARVDGLPARVYRTDGALLGLPVPAGAHRVELEFAPLLWTWARAISGLGALVFLGLLGAWAAAEKGRPRGAGRSGARPNW